MRIGTCQENFSLSRAKTSKFRYIGGLDSVHPLAGLDDFPGRLSGYTSGLQRRVQGQVYSYRGAEATSAIVKGLVASCIVRPAIFDLRASCARIRWLVNVGGRGVSGVTPAPEHQNRK